MNQLSMVPLSKKQQKRRAHVEAKQKKQQERARKKRLQRTQYHRSIHAALQEIGAVWERGGKAFLDGHCRYYQVRFRGCIFVFDQPRDISAWIKQQRQGSEKIDWAEVEIARLIEQAQQEMEQEED